MHLQKNRSLLGKVLIWMVSIFAVVVLSGWVNMTAGTLNTNLPVPPLAPPSGEGDAPAEPIDVIKNGDFEKPWQQLNGVAPDWSPYTNAEAVIGWYDEQWPEAVRGGEHAQLMEIFQVSGDILDRVIAIYQTVDVAPNSDYELTIHAILRTDAPEPLRNKFEYEMNWGVDPFGEGNYNNVEQWVYMDLTEQLRIGSNGEFPDDKPLFYERITNTIRTGDTNKITLFIRGLKKFPTGTEVNFDIDDVSLIGPDPNAQPAPEPAPTDETPAPAPADSIPQTGAALSLNGSIMGKFALGAMVLVILGIAATVGVLFQQKS
jgi:hypothetical protein